MNTYRTKFFAKCPVNGARIEYELSIHIGLTIPVEQIIEFVQDIKEGLHEEIADQLYARFSGSQCLKAEHHGVHIETIRPYAAHWKKP